MTSGMDDDGAAAAEAGRIPVYERTGLKPQELPKRFYREAVAAAAEGGWHVHLDGRAARTPGKKLLTLPTRPLAEAVAAEWAAQGEHIDPSSMPLTRLAVTALDGVWGREAEVAADMLRYGGSDLLCYRSAFPAGLAALQRERWDPVLEWARKTHGLRFVLGEGVVPVEQPAATLAALPERVEGADAFTLAALHTLTTLTGSAILMIALNERALAPDAGCAAAMADEDWQESQWGVVEEAAARRVRRTAEFHAACQLLDLLR